MSQEVSRWLANGLFHLLIPGSSKGCQMVALQGVNSPSLRVFHWHPLEGAADPITSVPEHPRNPFGSMGRFS